MLLGAQGAVEQAGPDGRIGRGVPPTKGRQGGHIHRAVGVEQQLQVATVQQGIETPHRQGEDQQGAQLAGGQGPALGQGGGALTAQQLSGHPAARPRPQRAAALGHHGGQRQEGRRRLLAVHRLGEGSGPGPQAQPYRPRAAGGGHHRQPQGGIEAFGPPRVHVVAEQAEGPPLGGVEMGGGHRQGAALEAAAGVEAGKKNARGGDQLGVVVIQQRHPIEAATQGEHALAAHHWRRRGGRRRGGRRGRGRWGGRGGLGKEHGEQGQRGRPPPQAPLAGTGSVHRRPVKVGAAAPTMARISSAERGSLKGPLTRKAATARWPLGI